MNDKDSARDERELVLGNRQLLGIFFVATLLCGVFFAMGYVVGGNSTKAVSAADAAASDEGKRDEPQPQLRNDSGSVTAAPSATSATSASGDTGAQLPTAEPKVTDNPAAAGAQPPTPAPATPAAAQPAQNIPSAKQSAPAPAPVAAGVPVSTPESGTSYWQIAAEQRPAADGVVKDLRERGLPAILAKSSKPELFEILVGPYRSPLALSDAKRKLTELGFDRLIVHKQQ